MVQSPTEKTRPPCPPLGQPLSCTPGLLEPHSYPVSCRVEEVNWAAWEQTLPTVFEEPSGRGGPGAITSPALASQSSQDSAVEEDHVPLQPLESH